MSVTQCGIVHPWLGRASGCGSRPSLEFITASMHIEGLDRPVLEASSSTGSADVRTSPSMAVQSRGKAWSLMETI